MSAAAAAEPRIDPPATALLSDPLDFFFAEHFRQRKLCNCVEELARAETLDQPLAGEVLAFLQHDMALHVLDEEQDLFPMMLLRCTAEDEIERVLSALTAEHAGDRHLADIVIGGLETAPEEGLAPGLHPQLREAMIDFARNERRHLALENSVVLPLARLRLTPEDLAELSRRLGARRGERPSPEDRA